MSALNMAFFTWHARLEANHARHTWKELESFLRRAARSTRTRSSGMRREMLDGVAVFWRGLDEQRRAIEGETRHVNVH